MESEFIKDYNYKTKVADKILGEPKNQIPKTNTNDNR